MGDDFTALSLDHSPDAVVATTLDGRVLFWSRGAQSLFGYGAEDAVGRDLGALLVPPDCQEEFRATIRDVQAHGSCTYESRRRRKDGSLVFVGVSTTLVRPADGAPPYLLSSKKDITTLKVAREAKQVESRFRELLDSVPDGILMVNLTGRVVVSNEQAQRLFGYTAGELRGQAIEMLLPERFRGAHVGHRASFFNAPRTRAMGAGLELYGLRKDGTEFPVEISLRPLHGDEGPLVCSAIRDISDRKRFEGQLQEKNLELASAMEAKDRFLAAMSHELRTPLNAIIGFTGTLLMRLPGPLNAAQVQQLETVQGSARHLLALINDLLDIAKIDAGKAEVNREPVECRALLENVAATLRPLADAKSLTLGVEAPDGALTVDTDRRLLSQIVLNLASNAIKFTEHGGVALTVRRARPEAEQAIEIIVVDTGIGISTEDQARLFGAFVRAAQRGTRQQEGTGIGLYLSRKLAGQLGGSITCRSERGVGSTFTLRLPDLP